MILMEAHIENDNTSEVVSSISEAVTDGLEKMGIDIMERAKEYAPVLTGNLRDSITYEVADDELVVGTDVPYSIEQELGGRYHPAANGGLGFLGIAFTDAERGLEALFSEAFS
jgi:phage gpG-like protein